MDKIYSNFNCMAAMVLWRSLWFIVFLRLTSTGVLYFVYVLYV